MLNRHARLLTKLRRFNFDGLFKAFYGEEIPPSNTGSDICKIEKGTDDDKSYIWYMTESVSRVIELKALEESSKLKHLVGCERSVIYSVNVGDVFINEINLDEAEQLLEEFPDIPREKRSKLLSSLDEKLVELNISSIVTSESLHFGKDKLTKLGAVKVSQWLDMVIDEVHVFINVSTLLRPLNLVMRTSMTFMVN